MKARKLNLENYKTDAGGDYDLKKSLLFVLFHPELRLRANQIIERLPVKDALAKASEAVLLEEAQWVMLRDSVNGVSGFGQDDIELIQRVLNAPQVDVGEPEPPKPN